MTLENQHCTGRSDYRDHGLAFPPNFLFGSATASYQIEGGVSADGRGASIWDTFCRLPGKVQNGDLGDIADDHYNRWESDLDLISELGLHAYRFSIAWPRIQPDRDTSLNSAGLAFYDRLIDGLLERNVAPIATLYHWDLPQWLEDDGGWPARDTASRFTDYTERVVTALGDRVHTWTTLNEPWCSAFLGYSAGNHAPGRTDEAASLAAAHHLNLAHGLAASRIRELATNAPEVSVTLNLHVFRGDQDASRRLDAVANRVFIDPMLNGRYAQETIDQTKHFTDWSFVQDGDLELINQRIDSLGINYYSTNTVRKGKPVPKTRDQRLGVTGSAWPGCDDVEFLEQVGPHTAMGWNIAPDALEDLLVKTSTEFPDLPLVITENGAAFDDEITTSPDGAAVHDHERVDYLSRHFTAAHRAIQRGVDLRGYLVWSLLDNFEWSYGYNKRFGIVHVDYDSLKRTIKDSGRWLQLVTATRTIP